MKDDARTIYNSLNRLLDLKQKQAKSWEARAANEEVRAASTSAIASRNLASESAKVVYAKPHLTL